MKNTEVFLALIRFILTDKKPQIPNHQYEWDVLYRLGKAHQLNGMLYEASIQLGLSIPEPIKKKFHKEYCRALSRAAIFQTEYERITVDFESERIPFIPLKGLLVKDYYPMEWMRTRADMDLLIQDKDGARVRERMVQLGYDVESYLKGNHDVYYLEPVVSVEIHKSLFEEYQTKWYRFFEEAEQRTWKSQPDLIVRHFSTEIHYVYLLTHMAKHMINGGIGVRNVLDIWLFWKKEALNFDRQSIENDFKALGIEQFHKRILNLGAYWMGEEPASAETERMTDMVFKSGTYGQISYQQMGKVVGTVRDSQEKGNLLKGRWKVLYRVLFPKLEVLQRGYPVLKHYPVLAPVIVLYRFGKGIFLPKSRRKATVLLKQDDREVIQYREYLRMIGLEHMAGD